MWEPIDITGQKFNMLTAIRYDHTSQAGKTYWLFKCDCGNEKIIIKTTVVTGKVKSCGCNRVSQIDDITGQKFNMLTAIKYDHSSGKGAYWLFECDCGSEKILRKTSVVNGLIKSCGCSKGKGEHTAHGDITGQKFGMLTAIEQDHRNYWLFKCDCGSEKVIDKSNVIRGFTKSCGCAQKKDITGQKFGKLTAIRYDHSNRNGQYWLFKCDCDQEKIINRVGVVNGSIQSCGCIRMTDITGQKFGKLTAIRYDHSDSHGCTWWLFKCDCGNEKVIKRNNVIQGMTKSCGCIISTMENNVKKLLTENQIPYEEQKSFDDCRDKYALRFDFYIPDLNLLIEAQGKQHYESIEYFGGQEKLDRQQRKDQIKRDYCSANNINLLEIKYDDDLESIIDEVVIQPWNIMKGDKSHVQQYRS